MCKYVIETIFPSSKKNANLIYNYLVNKQTNHIPILSP